MTREETKAIKEVMKMNVEEKREKRRPRDTIKNNMRAADVFCI